MTDERLRELYAHAMSTREGCITPDDMLTLVQRQGSEQSRLELLDHVMACAECRREFDLLRAVDVAGREYTHDAVHPRILNHGLNVRRTWWRDHSAALAAAVVLAAFGVGAGIVRGRAIVHGSTSGVMRGSSDTTGETGGIALITPAPDASVTMPVRLVWHPAPTAPRYRVEVLDASGAVVAGTTHTDTVFTVSASALRPGAVYSWWVRAETGGSQSHSALRRFRIPEAR